MGRSTRLRRNVQVYYHADEDAEHYVDIVRSRPRRSLHQALLDAYTNEDSRDSHGNRVERSRPHLDSPGHATMQPVSAEYPSLSTSRQDEDPLSAHGRPAPLMNLLQDISNGSNTIYSGDPLHLEHILPMRQFQHEQIRLAQGSEGRQREADPEHLRQLEHQHEADLQYERGQEREPDRIHDASIRGLVKSLVTEDELSTAAIILTNGEFPAQLQLLTLKAADHQSAEGCPICSKRWSRKEEGPETFPTVCGNGMSEDTMCSNFVCEDCLHNCASNQGRCPFCRQSTSPTDVERRRFERRRAARRVDAGSRTENITISTVS